MPNTNHNKPYLLNPKPIDPRPIKDGLIKSQPSFMLLLGFSLMFLASLWFLLDLWLVLFASILVSVFIVSLTELLKKMPFIGQYFYKCPHSVLVITVATLITGVLTGLFVLFGNDLIVQFGAMKAALPSALNALKSYGEVIPVLSSWVADQAVFNQNDSGGALQALFKTLTDAISFSPAVIGKILGGITTFVAIVLVGLFFAMSPQIYMRGFIRLIAPNYRNRGLYLLDRSYVALQRWLVGQFIVMAFVGITTAVGLYLMDIPFALALGFLAFVLGFIPVLGPWITAIPLLLVTLLFAPDMVLWVMALSFVIQQLESYVVAPIVQDRLVSLPPVALLLSQLIMGTLTGFLGIALATPLVVVVIVWVQILYVKFVLGDYQIVIMGQSDRELKDDPFNALPKGDMYADEMRMQISEGVKLAPERPKDYVGELIACRDGKLNKIKQDEHNQDDQNN